jgi:hypothetical protein
MGPARSLQTEFRSGTAAHQWHYAFTVSGSGGHVEPAPVLLCKRVLSGQTVGPPFQGRYLIDAFGSISVYPL